MPITLDGTNGVTTNSGTLISASTIGVGGATPSTSGAGITFPATQSASTDANTLDDYEEGTWTPTVIGTSTAGTASYSTQTGKYTKIGNVVYIQFIVEYSSGTGTGNLQISGLPFTSSTSSPIVVQLNDITLPANHYPLGVVAVSNTTIAMQTSSTGTASIASLAYDGAGYFRCSGFYYV